MDIRTTDSGLIRLLQLSSVSLPVGGYSFSQGLEYAIDCGWLRNQQQVHEWLEMQLLHSVAQVDLPLLRLCMQAAAEQDHAELFRLNDLLLACRESKELRLTDTAMGEALIRLLNSLQVPQPLPTALMRRRSVLSACLRLLRPTGVSKAIWRHWDSVGHGWKIRWRQPPSWCRWGRLRRRFCWGAATGDQ